ncbi:MAG: lytic transglycosylase domain-containing protein, partial [Deltaproteobacteria bacterium]|nr:lytic transglycosylase domain-containing protein [Deltaproteobacteria bacterium]
HSMVDDLFFWAGDLYQRRKRFDEAHAYYKRIQDLPIAGDHCGEATWRRAWIYYRNDLPLEAQRVLSQSIQQTSCTSKTEDRARAFYWLARISLDQGEKARAAKQFERVLDEAPLHYYAQLALTRLREVDAPRLAWLEAHLTAPAAKETTTICTGELAKDIYFQNGLKLLRSGFRRDAGLYLRRSTKGLGPTEGADCEPMQADLLLALLLNRAGFEQEAHWQVRSTFAAQLQKIPTHQEADIFFAAYPMAYSKEIAAAEDEHGIPPLFLQALAREESAFDASVVSWAGAYGLTQLLLSTAQGAGKLLTPEIKIKRASELFDPALNARLGGAFMASLISRFKGSTGLALCGYNAALRTANTWWKRHAGDAFDIFAEELTIKETRKYVKRVHQTWGIYRWLYQGTQPALATDPIPGATQTAQR